MAVINCPHCSHRVDVMTGVICPFCGMNTVETPARTFYENPVERQVMVQGFAQALMRFTPQLWVTPAIIAINVIVWVVMVACGADIFNPTTQIIQDWGGNFGPKTMNGEWFRLLTCMFLHCGILHIAMNMWILWDLGRLVERLVGHWGFAVLYFISGLAGSIASLAWDPTTVSAGASGAVFGVAGCLIAAIVYRRDTIPAVARKQLSSGMFTFLAINVFYGATAARVDFAAHVGGFVAGFCIGCILCRPLSIVSVSHRWRRNLVAAVIGLIALPTAIAALPPAPLDPNAELDHFVEVEKKAITRFGELWTEMEEKKTSPAQCADEIETTILPKYTESRDRMSMLAKSNKTHEDYFRRRVEYINQREIAWRSFVEAYRTDDPAAVERAMREWISANDLVKELNKK